ncbi:hypothetical protein Bp8pS_080 [Bacillus phage vB_BpuM-BpSp]|nr:hypothetical protein Bp8pS_080 [Bacillus phage vB_BpuM-BpSp]
MFKKLRSIFKKIECRHEDIERGSFGAIMMSSVDYYQCNKCGLYGDDGFGRNLIERNNYKKLKELYYKKRTIKRGY